MTAGVALTPWKDVGDKNRGVDERTTKMNYTTSALSGDGPITVIYKTGTAILLIDWRITVIVIRPIGRITTKRPFNGDVKGPTGRICVLATSG